MKQLNHGNFILSKSPYKGKVKIEFHHHGITFNEIHLDGEQVMDLLYILELAIETGVSEWQKLLK